MTAKEGRLQDALEKLFHEPNRLAIMASLCAEPKGLPFTGLRDACGLTDGNLNRHLKVLVDAEAVRIKKAFVDDKPRTTVRMTALGLRRFEEYLAALNDVLKTAQKALPKPAKRRTGHAALRGKTATT